MQKSQKNSVSISEKNLRFRLPFFFKLDDTRTSLKIELSTSAEKFQTNALTYKQTNGWKVFQKKLNYSVLSEIKALIPQFAAPAYQGKYSHHTL